MAGGGAAPVRSILDKMNNTDPDFRYMATSDLLDILNSKQLGSVDVELHRRLCDAVFKLLADSSSEVQAMAQRCLPPLSKAVDQDEAVRLVSSLLGCVLTAPDPVKEFASNQDIGVGPRKSIRDVASLGLKSVITELPMKTQQGAAPSWSIADALIPRLLEAVASADAKSKGREDSLVESLELLQALLVRLGPSMFQFHDDIREAVLPRMGSAEPFVAKRATSCIAALAPACPPNVLSLIVNAILTELRSARHARLRSAMHAMWAVSKSAGNRLAPSLPTIVPIVFKICRDAGDQDDDELRENCLQALESLILRCPRDMALYSDQIVSLVSELAKHDPNILESGSDDDSKMNDGGSDDEDDYGDDEDDEFSDDDDLSWKVRRAAVKCVHAAISSRLRPVGQLYDDFGVLLVTRFKEREESVKLDVFAAFGDLLRQSAPTNSVHTGGVDAVAVSRDSVNSGTSTVAAGATYPLLSDGCEKIVSAVKKQLEAKSVKTRVSAMGLLRELVAVTPATVAPLLHKLVDDIQRGLSDSSAQMKTETLVLLHNVVQGCPPTVLQRDGIYTLVPRVLQAADDRYYKITAESLRLSSAFLTAFGGPEDRALHGCMSPLVPGIHDAAMRRLTAHDQDSEVREACLDCVGGTVSLYGSDVGPDRLSMVGSVLCDRLSNEVTRLPTARALNRIALSEYASVLTPVVEPLTRTVGSFLRKSNNPLRLAALSLLTHAPPFSSENDAMLMRNVSALVSDADLRLASLSLRLCSRLTRTRGQALCPVLAQPDGVLERALNLMTSPLLQERAVEALRDIFKSLAEVNCSPLSVEVLLEKLRAKALEASEKGSLGSARISGSGVMSPVQVAAKCVAEVCEGSSVEGVGPILEAFITEVSSSSVHVRVCALSCLGELGRKSLLELSGAGKQGAQAAVLSALDSGEESLKSVAAVALGGVASGDSTGGFPGLVDLVRQRPENRYLLLLALRDAIAFSKGADVMRLTGLLLEVLLDEVAVHNETGRDGDEPGARASGQESVHIATSECLGILAQVNPEDVIPALKERCGSSSASLRCAIVTSIKYIVTVGPSELVPNPALGSVLQRALESFLVLAADEDVNVRKNAVQSINAIARAQPMRLAPHLVFALERVYEATVKNSALVRWVDLGPFKFEEDFGLDLRKSGFDSMRTIISGPLATSVGLSAFVDRLVDGLKDVPDVRSIAQLTLSSIAALPIATPVILASIDRIVAALEGTLHEKLKSNAVRQEVDRHEDSLKGALRAVLLLDSMAQVSRDSVFVAFMNRTVKSGELLAKYKEVVNASTSSSSGVRRAGPDLGDEKMRD